MLYLVFTYLRRFLLSDLEKSKRSDVGQEVRLLKSVEEKILGSLSLVKSMVEEGSTDKEIAEKLEIGLTTWKKYKAECSQLKETIAEAKDNKNQQVEQSLFKLCNGYHYTEEVVTKVKEEVEGENGTVLIKEDVKISKVKKYCKPDLGAQKYWLGNKKKAQWKENPHAVEQKNKELKLKKKEVESKIIE